MNIRYMLAGDRNSRFLAWLRAYIEYDKRQINNWEARSQNVRTTKQSSIEKVYVEGGID